MIVDELKKSILNFAFQGKLTDRLDTDSSVDDLLKQISNERKDNILNLVDDDEISFIIPKEWKWVRWGNLSNSIQYGINTGAKSKGNAKLVRISDIQNNEIMWDNVPYCDVNYTEIQQYLLFENDILFARTGGTVGKSVVVKNIPTDMSYIFAGYLIRSNYNSKINYKYLKFFMESNLYWSQLKNGTIGSAQPNCNGKTLSKMILPLPPVEEQQRIVNKIEELFSKLEEIKPIEDELRMIKESFPNEIKKSILSKLFNENEDRLKEKLSIIVSFSNIKNSEHGENKYLEVKYLRGNIEPKILNKGKYVTKGTLSILVDGENSGEIFKISENGYLGSTLRPLCLSKKILEKYLMYYLMLKKDYFKSNKRGSAIPHLDKNLFFNSMIYLPSIEEQQRIVDKLEKLLPLCDDLEKLINIEDN